MMTGFGWDMGLGGWLWMGIGVVLVIVLIWALVYAVNGRERPISEDAAAILRARFARGEISQAEYEQAKKALGL
jgi:putative membrane protein